VNRKGEVEYENVDPVQLIGLATIMASYGTDGKDIYPPAPYIADHAGKSVRTVKTLRQQAITLGLFRKVGTRNGRDCLVISIPPDGGTVQPTARLAESDRVTYSTPSVQPIAREVSSHQGNRAADCTPTVQHTAPNLSNSKNYTNIDEDPPSWMKEDPTATRDVQQQNESQADELRRLIREAPDKFALDCLWQVRKSEWTAELTELAKARKGQLVSAAA
jgi:hypothetical protein